MIKCSVGGDATEESDSTLHGLLNRFNSILALGGGDNTTNAVKRESSAPWSTLLTDIFDFLEKNISLLSDEKSQALRIHEDIGILIDIAHTKALKEGINDKSYLMERIIKLAASLPDGSETRNAITGILVKGLWDSLQHPPLSYLGDEYVYRTADGSNNNVMYPKLGMAGSSYAKSVRSLTRERTYPDPSEVFDKLLARRGLPKEHPNKISSMLFYLAIIIIHDLFRTGNDTDNQTPNFNISSTSSYLDLSPLYGNNDQEQHAVRTMKDGMLKPDTFSEYRILGFPPGVSALLISFNRFHNYVAENLKQINEGGRFCLNPSLSKDTAEKVVDNALFNTARLSRGSYSDVFKNNTEFPMGTGNQVSAEFNLIYRWHGNLSVKDEAWTQDFMQDLFPGQDFTKLPLREFLRRLGKWKDRALAQKPETRTFGNLKRNSSGTFDTKELVSLIAQSTQDVSAAFGANQVPEALKPIIILGMSQARSWHVGTLNELRKFMGLAPHKSFADINSDTEVQEAMKALYKDPDHVELYPGVIFEESKKPVYPGSGLCAGFTITRAILSDAVTLVRGDRFYTLDWTPAHMTEWGYNLIQPDKPQDKLARGGKIHHLLDVAFPNFYGEKSVWKLFPFTNPDEIKRIFDGQGVAGQYDFSSPLS
ncbi:heme peroxidase [Penicillium occitanis (nom. inval.)]|nr:heme peroxidase [Penicillium occitanis (nom. inval.)]PCG91230.1 hypothetical protein PENOC_098360 [Penicillium occitanis (nom. inval.)]